MATGDPDYISKDALPQYVPIPFPATYPRGTAAATPAPSGGTSGGSTENGAVYAAALFVNAACQASDRVGAWVRAADATSAVVTTTSQLSYPAIGLLVSKTSDTTCVVQTYGLCGGVYSGLTPNLRLFVGPSGQASTGAQLPSGTAYVQPVGFSVRSDTIFIQPSGTLFRRDVAADSADPAPSPGDTATYQPVLHGPGAPLADVGRPGDVYLATDTLTLYQRDDTGWGDGRALTLAGKAGASTLTGSGAPPDSLGDDGDTYIAVDVSGQAVTFYGKKENGSWPAVGTSLVGAPGADAAPGPTITGGNGAPDPNSVGQPGSLYLDRINLDLYQAQA